MTAFAIVACGASVIGLLLFAGRKHRYSRVVLPWFAFARGDDQAARLHRLALSSRGTRRTGSVIRFALTWPLLSLLHASVALTRYGRWVKQESGVGLWPQWWQMVFLANTLNITAEAYYAFRLWEAHRRARAHLLVQEHEHTALMKALRARQRSRITRNKVVFYQACVASRVPTVPVIAAFECDGSERWFGPTASLPSADLFLKRASSHSGRGAECWRHDEAAKAWRRGDLSLSEEQLVAHCRQLSKETPMLIQPRLKNHPALKGFFDQALSTLRVVTWKLPGEDPTVMGCIWRMALQDAEVDNFHAGGIAVLLNPDGTLAHGIRWRIPGETHEHPNSGRRISGAPLPFASEMMEVALAAHRTLDEPLSVGWDIAATEDGVLVVEANLLWESGYLQTLNDMPLIETQYLKMVSTLYSE